jgi:hypothetical protein
MRMGRPIPELVLTKEELETLQRWARRPQSAQALAQRARLVLACAQGKSNTAVSREMDLTLQTIGKWRSRFWFTGWMVCWMSRGRELRAGLATPMWSAS